METAISIIQDLRGIHERHRIPFEEKTVQPITQEIVDRLDKAHKEIQKEVVDKKLLERIRDLPGLDVEEKNSIAGLVAQSSLNTAILLLSIKRG